MNHIESGSVWVSKKNNGTAWRQGATTAALAAILTLEACSTTSWAAIGGGIWAFGWPITAAAWAAVWAELGKWAEASRERDHDVKKLLDAVPASLLEKSVREWKPLAHFVSPDNSLVFAPVKRSWNTVTFNVTARYGKENRTVGPVEIDKVVK